MRATGPWRGPWGEAPIAPGPVVFAASWARGEPERGRYDDGELAAWRKAAVAARRGGARVWVAVHGGALPDWQIGREGWLDPDVLANFGCWVDRLGRALTEAVDGWWGVWDPLGEARWYDAEARRVGRVLLDAQAAAHVQLRRGTGAGAVPVGAAVAVGGGGPIGRRARRWAAETWVRCAATGRIGPPWGIAGELANGEGALDVLGILDEEIGGSEGVERM